jgi:transposase
MQSTTIIAFDQHAATTVAALLVPGQRTPALHSLTSDSSTIIRFVTRVVRENGAVRCCYEAGPCGFELQRALAAAGIPCEIIAPALIPRRAGDRIKTDRRDAAQLAILSRAGALTAIHVPTDQEEAVRDLLRCREDIRADLLRARHRLGKFLLRHGRRFTATKQAWSKRHDTWLRAQTWPLPALTQTHEAYLRAVDEAVARLRTVDAQLQTLVTLEPLHGRVQRLRCFRGMDDLTALTIAAELSDARRFPMARGLMAYVGLIPSEHSSGTKRARRDHQNRQCASPPGPRRSGVALSPPSLHWQTAASPARGRARRREAARVARATAALSPLPMPRRAGQTQTACRHRDRPRAHRLRLGEPDPLS